MPGWNIHLEAGERVAQRLKLPREKKEEFLLGCILPDINNSYVNNAKVEKEHSVTHWKTEGKGSENFFRRYKEQILDREPIFLGYFLHLFTDEWFNSDFYRRMDEVGKGEMSHGEKLEIKHNDFWIFDAKFWPKKLEFSHLEELIKKANEVSSVEIFPEDLVDVQEILSGDKFFKAVQGKKYLFYTEKELDELLSGLVEGFLKTI